MILDRLLAAVVAGSLLAFSGGVLASPPAYRVHYSLLGDSKPTLPKRVIILPVSIVVKEKTYGGVTEPVDKWSDQASKNIFQALADFSRDKKTFTLVKTPGFSSSERAKIIEHLALYKKVVNTASWATSLQPVWKHKLRKFDYTIGPGLDFLRRKTGADTAMLVYGEDEISTGGAAAATVISKVFGGTRQFGTSYINLGLVDLRTGALLWLNREFKGGTGDLRRAADARNMIDDIFEKYPGIEKYRRAYVN